MENALILLRESFLGVFLIHNLCILEFHLKQNFIYLLKSMSKYEVNWLSRVSCYESMFTIIVINSSVKDNLQLFCDNTHVEYNRIPANEMIIICENVHCMKKRTNNI